MADQRIYRYPGVKPFTTQEQIIFRGRKEDVKALIQLVTRKRLVVLFGKSGLGKSSLLNAGLIPALTEVKAEVKGGEQEADFYYEPQSIRFGAWSEAQKDTRISPVEAIKSRLGLPATGQTYLDRMLPEDDSLWKHLKKFQALAPIQSHFLLLFDQFEELFTYPDAEIEHFHQELGEVLNAKVPQRYRSILGQEEEALSEEEELLLFEPIDLRIVMAIRSDRLAMLDRLSEKMPDILENRYQLKALSRKEAEDAIFAPSILPQDPNFQTPGFNLEEEALDHIIQHLTRAREGSQDIESFQLQVICQHIEQELVERAGKRSIGTEDLGDLSDIFEQYYESKMGRLPHEEDRQRARIFIENGLILEQDERRLSLYEGMIQRDYQVSEALLFQLVGTGLLRAEPDPKGGFSYELAHDTLVEPILRAKRKRVAEEEKLLAEQRLAEERAQLAEERRKRRRATLLAWGAGILAIVALATSAWAFLQTREANVAKEKAEISESEATKARDSIRIAFDELESGKLRLERLNTELDSAKTAADSQRIVAEINEELARSEASRANRQAIRAEVQSAIAQVTLLYNQNDYDSALIVLDSAYRIHEGIEAEALGQTYRIGFFRALDNTSFSTSIQFLADMHRIEEAKIEAAEVFVESLVNLQERDRFHLNPSLDVNPWWMKEPVVVDALPMLVQKTIRYGAFQDVVDLLHYYQQAGGEMKEIQAMARQAIRASDGKPWYLARKKLSVLGDTTISQPRNLVGGYPMPEFVLVEGGTFWMGDSLGNPDEVPVHSVTLSSYEIGRFELTAGQYCAFLNTLPEDSLEDVERWIRLGFQIQHDSIAGFVLENGQEGFCLIDVSWYGATAYCRWLSRETGQSISLPTEAQWEFAAIGGTEGLTEESKKRFAYAGSDTLGEVGWYNGNASFIHPVGMLTPNSLGTYDMSGNVWEWCQDRFDRYPEESDPNPTGPETGDYRVLRGGSWYGNDSICRVSYRSNGLPYDRIYGYGFRLTRN